MEINIILSFFNKTNLYKNIMNAIKFTEQELAEIKMLQSKFQEKIFDFGKFKIERMHLLELVKRLEEREAKSEKEYINLQDMENALLGKLTAKYGEGSLNLEDGTFIPIESVTK